MKNRIKELRESLGLSRDALGAMAKTTGSTVYKLENNIMALNTKWMERLAAPLNVRPGDLIADDAATAEKQPIGFLAQSTVKPIPDSEKKKLGRVLPFQHNLYLVISPALDELGILQGDYVEIDENPAAWRNLTQGHVVLAEVLPEDDEESPVTLQVLREYIEPNLLITNSKYDNEPIINMSAAKVKIVGIAIGARRNLLPTR